MLLKLALPLMGLLALYFYAQSASLQSRLDAAGLGHPPEITTSIKGEGIPRYCGGKAFRILFVDNIGTAVVLCGANLDRDH